MIGVRNIAKSFGARTLFQGVSLELLAGARYGLVGANGAGKTTFLGILAGDEPASDGSVTFPARARVGVLRQDRFLNDAESILDVAMAGDEIVSRAMAEQRELVDKGVPDAARLAELEEQIAAHDGYTLEARASQILEGLGIPVRVHRDPLGTLSGGFKLRVLLAQVLVGGPDAILLDEPTNHLDILSIRWLEKFLAAYRGCAVIISHDQRFLDNVVTHVLDVDYGTITQYTGNYSAFVTEKAETRARKEAELERQRAVIEERRAWVERFKAKATKARQAQSRLKQIERIEQKVEVLAPSSRRTPSFSFVPRRASGKDVLTIEEVSKAYGENRVLTNVSLAVRRGERVAIIGANGLGKSTLLKIATNHLAADSGTVAWGYETHVGYFAQDHRDVLCDPKTTPLDVIWNTVPEESTSFVRGQLGRVLFSGDDVQKPVGALSGGEAARLVFCRIMVQRPNVLVLDEPTNHLDLESIEALVSGLQAFDGTLLFVSHDRAFVSALATRVVEVTADGLRDFPGTYEEYLARCGDDHLDAEAVVQRARKAKSERKNEAPEKKALSWEEQKRRNNRKKQLPGLRDAVLAKIEQAEARRAWIRARFADPDFYVQTEATEFERLEKEEKELGPKIEAWLAEWEALESEIAALAGEGSGASEGRTSG